MLSNMGLTTIGAIVSLLVERNCACICSYLLQKRVGIMSSEAW